MNELEELKQTLNDYRNSIKKDFKDEELVAIDASISKAVNDMTEIFSLVQNIQQNKVVLTELKQLVDTYMQEEKWLEKP